MSTKHDPDFAGFPANVSAEVRVAQLQELCTNLYVGVLGHLYDCDVPNGEVDTVLDAVLAAGEGRPFQQLRLPWPARD